MANAKSHHLNNPEQHVLVAIDGQPREASYTTDFDDGSKGASVHVLYYEKHPDQEGASTLAQTGGEVRSCPYDEWKKPTNPIYEPPAAGPILARDAQGAIIPLTMDDIVGTDVSALPAEAQEALRLFGGVDSTGKVLAAGKWVRRGAT